MRKSCVQLPRMPFLATLLILGLFSSVRFALSEFVINEVSLETDSIPKFSYVELLNKDDPVVEDDYLLVLFYNTNATLSLPISKLQNVSSGSDIYYVVVSSDINLTVADNAEKDQSTKLPVLGDTVAAIALFIVNSSDTFSLNQTGFYVENVTLVDAFVFTTTQTQNFNSTDLAMAFGFETNQIAFGYLNQSLSRCGNDTLTVFKKANKTPGSENNCEVTPPVSTTTVEVTPPVSSITTVEVESSSVTGTTQDNSPSVTSVPVTTSGPNPVTKVASPTTTNNSSQATATSISQPTTLISSNPSTTANQSVTSNPSNSSIPPTQTSAIVPPTQTPSENSSLSTNPASSLATTAAVPTNPEKPTVSQQVVISEVYVNPPTTNDIGEYVELQDLSGKENVSLNGWTLIFWNGANLKKYFMQDLTGYMTGPNGYFVLSNVDDNNTHVYHAKGHFIQNGNMDGIALYKNLNMKDLEDGKIRTDNMIDAVVYSSSVTHGPDDTLLKKLFPDQTSPIYMFTFSNHTTLARCYSNDGMDLAAFTSVNSTTKAAPNNCPPPKGLRINEVKLSSSKFIEITSGERPLFPLEQMVLTTFNATTNQTTGSLRLKGRTNSSLSLLAENPFNSTLLIDDDNITMLLGSLSNTNPGAVALYWRPNLVSDPQIAITTEGLLDIVIYGPDTINASSTFLAAFDKAQVNIPTDVGNKSVNFCPHYKQKYFITIASPNDENQCPVPLSTTPTTPVAFQINEVYFGNLPNFVELKGQPGEHMNNLLLAFLESGTPVILNSSVKLVSKSLSQDGLHVVEGQGVTLPLSDDKDCAVALYELQSSTYIVTTFDKLLQEATLLDFVVYSTKKTMNVSEVMKKLAGAKTDQIAIWADKQSSLSITRCNSPLKENWSFWLMQQSKDGHNTCPIPEVLINEVNVDNPSHDFREFLELYDFGIGHVSLNPFVIVAFNGNTKGKRAAVVDLWNERTDENGFFLLAVAGHNLSSVSDKTVSSSVQFFQNGPEAIALYQATPSTFDRDSEPAKNHLVDVVIYGKNTTEPLIQSLINALTPGGSAVISANAKEIDLSMSRCLCWGTNKKNNGKAFYLSRPSPSKTNLCSDKMHHELPPLAKVFINELNSDSPNRAGSEFLELKGPHMTKLDNFNLVFYNLSSGQPIKDIKLDGKSLDKDGFFIIGAVPKADIVVQEQMFLERGLGAIALYDRRRWKCIPESQMAVSRPGRLDAIVYASNNIDIDQAQTDFLHALKIDYVIVEDTGAFTQDETISRCSDDPKMTSSRFAISLPTLRAENICPSAKYQLTISFKLIDADCVVFTKSESLKMEVANRVVTNVNKICHCGFTLGNLASYQILCGSVIFDATVYTVSKEQSHLIEESYTEFVKSSDTVKISNQTYTVDKTCLRHCLPAKPLTKKPENHTVTIAVVVTCVSLLAIICVLIFVYYKRKRKGIAHFRMARFDAEDENLTVGDMDDFVGGGGEQASFNNPLYFK